MNFKVTDNTTVEVNFIQKTVTVVGTLIVQGILKS